MEFLSRVAELRFKTVLAVFGLSLLIFGLEEMFFNRSQGKCLLLANTPLAYATTAIAFLPTCLFFNSNGLERMTATGRIQ
jgi:hypothetical protein